MFFESWSGLLRVVIVGPLAYATLVFVLRLSGKRTLAKLNAFDLIVTVALGSTLATVLLSKSVALAEGVLAFATLAALQFVVAWLSVRSPAFSDLVKSEPTLLLRDGCFLEQAMRRQRVTRDEVVSALRNKGSGAAGRVAAVVLETDGTLSVIENGPDIGSRDSTSSVFRRLRRRFIQHIEDDTIMKAITAGEARKTREHMHETRNKTPSNAKKVSLHILQARLADGIDLALVIKQAHWNLKGPSFIGIHLMLDGFESVMDDFNDKVAERITQLGGTAEGTITAVAAQTSLAPYPLDAYAIADHLAALIDRYAVYANAVRDSIDKTDEAGDAGTADLFTEISRGVDKQLWFLEAHVQEPTGRMRDGNGKGEKE